jgi:hypothetical protein
LRKRLHILLRRWGRSNIAAKLNKGVFSETLNSFIALTVETHVTHSGYNFQSCIVAGMNSLRQEINKHHTLSASVNQVVSYWLLPFLRETTEHKDQGMTATLLALPWFPRSSKPSTQPHF